ncbi:protein FAR1-RELATED SEQUENCE 5-like [Chenopodium quinoa]|uniref:protein FAR1-RELATED SEQUENCE 5-like n=1 Tax=Chenopodium quinoa TaxID=63459 RepID=UPI000B798359|nr:protein FAR1-RELATED SEQUENCE 5-like [Chenopodium quinoa]
MVSSEVAEDICVSLYHNEEGGIMDLINFKEGEGARDIGELCPYEGGEGDGDGGNMVNLNIVKIDPPEVGMIFDTQEEVDMYYNAFGKHEGAWCGSCPECILNSKRWSQGLKEHGKWEVVIVELKHEPNKVSPSKSMLVTNYRLEELEKMRYVGMLAATMHKWLASERNGVENMPFTKKDVNNLISRENKLKLKDGDNNAMINYFQMMQKNNKNLYHIHRLDANGVLQDVFWVDARSRAAYEDFGDVVCFDTTFFMNKYDFPFANIVGVNHHGQTILLGCALISHEDTETFTWLFSTWLDVVGGKPSAAILTDQDPAMRKALKAVMPQTRYRWCLWYIKKKFGSKLGKYKGYVEFKNELKNIIYDSLFLEEFELRWKEFIVKYKLESNLWLAGLCDFAENYVAAME